MNNKINLETKVSRLETQVDFLEKELSHLNEILVRAGFPEGIKTLKETVEELFLEEAVQKPSL